MSKKRIHRWQRVACPECDQGFIIVEDEPFGYARYYECGKCNGTGQINVSQEEARKRIALVEARPS